jgi:Bacterial Ig-like domain (group 3)
MPTQPKRSLSIFAALTAVVACLPLAAQVPVQPAPHSVAGYGKVPLYFERNDGQADPAAKFVAHGPGYSILLQPTAATLMLHHSAQGKRDRFKAAAPAEMEVVRMTMLGTNPEASMAAAQPGASYVNYMNSSNHKDWHLGVPTSLQARTNNLYPGIDVVFYGNSQRALEYDFTVAPGADTTSIRIAVSGAKPVAASDGSLRLQTGSTAAAQDLRFGKPVLYQELAGRRQPVEGAFIVASNGEVGFQVGTYDHTRTLVIDPIISYASYFGGTGEDEINAVALNASGQLYAVGQTYSTALPGTTGEFETGSAANNNGHDAFVTKFSADGSSILWTTYLSGGGDDFATGVAVNSSDQPYIVGYTASCGDGGLNYSTAGEFPFVGGVQPLCNPDVRGFNNYESNGAGYDAFLVKLSSDGKTELYGTPLGGTANDIADSVALDASGKVYIVGETQSTMYVLSSNLDRASDVPSYPVNNHGNAAIGRSNYPTTSGAFYTNITESKNNSVTCDSSGNCPGAPIGSVSGTQDEQAFLTVLSADLNSILYSTLLGGPVLGNAGNGTSATNGIAVAVNGSGIAFIGGNTSSAHWPVTSNAFASTCANAGAASSTCNLTGWLAAFDPTKAGAASLLFTTYVNGLNAGRSGGGNTNFPGSDVFGLATDTTGNVIVTGDTNAVDFPTTTGTLQPSCFKFNDGNSNTNVCESEAFLTKVSPAGAIVWSTYLGATQQDIGQAAGRAVATDASNNVYVFATTSSSYLPTKNSVATPNSNDGYVAELSPTASTLLLGTYIGIGGGFTPNNNSLPIDANGTVYLSGSQAPNPYGGTSFPVTANAADKTIQGADGFVLKLITQQQPTTTALTVSPTSAATPSQTVTLTATLTTTSTLTGTLLPTGTVTFFNGTTTIGTAKLNTSGVAIFTGTLASGTYTITASYPGDAAFAASVSGATPLSVSSAVATTTTETVTPAASTYGSPVVLTATVLAGTTPALGGTVTFTAGTVTLGTATVNAQGVATTTVTPAIGVYTVIANYAGNYNQTSNPNGYGPSVSAGAPLTVTKAASTITLAASSTTVGAAATFTLTATVPTAATGTVTFNNGTTALGTGTIANGVATLSTAIATVGSYSLTAVYAGDTNFTGSVSSVLTVTVAAPGFTVTANPSSLTLARGATGTSTLTFTPTGFTGTLTLICGTLPSKLTCSFNPATVTLAGNIVTSTLTIGTGSLAALSIPALPGHRSNDLQRSLAFLLPGSLLAMFGLTRRHRSLLRKPFLFVLAAAAVGVLGILSGCGNSNSGANATPAGSYNVVVTVTGGTAGSQSVPLTIVVR